MSFASVNAAKASKDALRAHGETAEALEARLVGAYESAIRGVAAGHRDAARERLQVLLREPLLQQQQREDAGQDTFDGNGKGPAAAAAAAGRRRRFGRLRFLALRNLAPLLGDSWEGLEAACAAAQADPSDCELWGSIAALAARLGDLALSRHATERALALRPRAAPPAERLVLLLGAAGDWRGAVRALLLLGRADGAHPWW
ncbi:hypothetical protein MNEG_13287 [Monoraphidium neglectum]|uniref:Uncharacterized protein n=1 Tax=Monoraphidium neglectum TaxID=145388 RepID=A0A0D2LZ72_9CHLO|nr:hypothetical protein MNEG_13287 [Monoraphidium neglectum]KIY94676.1 hypothetical protein MNEG_13287 [Monoraphidium neglectum]|eukprot:XP_013893696.1 hypothetical protein MNEG_13287 [Monoraphidium neglectum]